MKLFYKFIVFLSLTTLSLNAETLSDICYEPIEESGYSFGPADIMYTTKIPIRNLNETEDLTDVIVAVGSESLFDAVSECGIDDEEGNCEKDSGGSIFVVSAFNEGVTYDLGTLESENVEVPYEKSLISLLSSDDYDIVGSYVKDGVTYTGTVAPCANYTCANPKEFTPYFSKNIYGKLIIAGNTSLCADNNKDGVCEDPGDSTNNSIYMINNDYDDVNGTANNNATTTNSSAAYLNIPEGKTVLWAGLTWQGYMANRSAYDNPDENAIDWTEDLKKQGKSIKFKHQSDNTYQTSSDAQMNWVYFSEDRMYYQSFLDITDYVNDHKGGYYWVGDIATSQGQPRGGSFGAWSITVVYEDNDEDFNNITVYNGYKAFANTTDINNAKAYAEANDCDVDNTGLGNETSSTLSGFLTPKSGDISSNLVVFAGEGDIGLTGDWGSITDKDGEEHKLSNELNPENNIMNATISDKGVSIRTGLPYYSDNTLGADIDVFDASDILSHEQTTTDIKFSTTGDGYMPGLYGLQTELYIPKFCYDYAYEQNEVYFTEENDGSKLPRIKGIVNSGTAIKVKVFLRNLVDSDINVTDMVVNVVDINTSQATYIRETTQLANNGDITPTDIPDSDLDVSDEYIKDIQVGTISSNDYFYVYYQLDPSTSDLNISLDVEANYNMTYDDTTIPYSLVLGKDMPLCTTSNFKYSPSKGIFNVVHHDYYDADEADGENKRYYNIPTQVSSREGNFKLLILDPEDPEYNTLLDDHDIFYTEVEMIDASAFHDTNASCYEPLSAITTTVGLLIDANVTSVPFDKDALVSAIEEGRTSLTTSSEFYQAARRNAAFRVRNYRNVFDSYNQPAYKQNEDGTYDTAWQMNWNGENCVGDVNENGQSNNNDKVANYCQDGHSLNSSDVEKCTRCVSVVQFICSRDNFAIRPEAFLMQLDDQNQTNTAQQSNITTLADSGSATATIPTLNLAAGYNYNLEVNATNHINNSATPGYMRSFNIDNSVIAKYQWSPLATQDISGCNDTNDSNTSLRFINGVVDTNTSLNNVGRYQLMLIDKSWTVVDYDPNYMTHHTGDYFTDNTDCQLATNVVFAVNSTIDPDDTTTLNGCEITSNHNNSEANIQYNDFVTLFHPYKFDFNSITPSVGLNNTALNGTTDYIYYADISNNDDENMSYHLNGYIKALGENNATLSNFVGACYAQAVDLKIETLQSRTLLDEDGAPVVYMARLHDLNSSNVVQTTLDVNVTDTTPTAPMLIQTTAAHFIKDLKGAMNTHLNLNYKRAKNKTINPSKLSFVKYSAQCTNTTNCAYSADLTTKSTDGEKDLNSSIIIRHYYGRTHVTRQRYVGQDGNATINYEVYCDGTGCDKTLLQNGTASTFSDDPRWFINTHHSSAFGVPGDINQKGFNVGSGHIVQQQAATGNLPDQAKLHYDKSRGYPYKSTMENNASGWLIYNQFDATRTKNEFEVEFTNDNSAWAGKHETDNSTNKNAANKTNRRTMW